MITCAGLGCENEARYLLDNGLVTCSLCAMGHPGRSVRFSDDEILSRLVEEDELLQRQVERGFKARIGAERYRVFSVEREQRSARHFEEDHTNGCTERCDAQVGTCGAPTGTHGRDDCEMSLPCPLHGPNG